MQYHVLDGRCIRFDQICDMQVVSFVNDCGDENRLVLKIGSLADIVTYPCWVKCKLQLQAKFGLF